MPAPCVKAGGCVALAAVGSAFCTAHSRGLLREAERRWLDWAESTPTLSDCRDALVRRDPPPWWARPFHEDNYDA